MINRIFISTAIDKWDPLFSFPENQWNTKLTAFKNDKTLSKINPAIYFDNMLASKTNTVDSTIILLFDDLDDLPDSIQINEDTDLLLYHSTTKEKVHNKFINKDSSRHDSGLESKFRQVFMVFLDENIDDKFKVLIDKVFDRLDKDKIEHVKIDFLYSILNGKTPENIPDKVTKTKEVVDLFNFFKNNPYKKDLDYKGGDDDGKDQRIKLALLRDAFLPN